MSIDPAVLRALANQGVSADIIVSMIEADAAVQADKVAKRRADTAARVRKHRAKGKECNASNALPSVTDVTLSPNDIYSNPHTIPLDVSDETSPPVSEIDAEPILTLQPEHVVEAWNDMAGRHSLPKAKLTPDRRRKLLARLKQHSVDEWTEAIGAIERNPWMHGDNDRGWRVDFDFLLQSKSFTKLIEGSYDRASQSH